MKLNFDVIIIGAGPAGMTAAINLKRAGLKILLVDSLVPGGQLNQALMIENYPGFLKIEGPSLALKLFQQVEALEIPYQYGEVIELINYNQAKGVKFKTGKEIRCQQVIIATGRKPKELGLKAEKKLLGRGVSYCAYCDGALFKHKEVVIVGGGEWVVSEIEYLKTIVKKLIIIDYSGNKSLYKRYKNNIEVLKDHELVDLKAVNNCLNEIQIKTLDRTQVKTLKADGLFVNIGFAAQSKWLQGLGLKIEDGYIIVNEKMQTNIIGIYACGDIIKKDLYQVATAVGEGALASYYVLQTLK